MNDLTEAEPEPRPYVPGTCVLAHRTDPDRLRPAMDGAWVCWGCHAKALRQLVQLAPLHRTLGEIVAIATAGPRSGPRSAEIRVPLHDAAADCRRDIRTALTEWAVVVVDARGLVPPPLDPEQASQRAVDQLAGWLLAHHDWLLYEHPGAYAMDLGDLHRSAFALTYPSGRRPREFAPCPQPDCAGMLSARLAPGDLLPEVLTCNACGWQVPPSRWLAGRPGRWLTVVELAVILGVSVRTVERAAAKWPSDGGRPARYDADLATRAYESGRAALTQVRAVSQDACHRAITVGPVTTLPVGTQ